MSVQDPFRVEGKVALVSGSARGIGAQIVEALVEGGASVLVTDILDSEGGQTAARFGRAARFARLDATKEADWEAAVARAVSEFGGLDIVVNNAGAELAGFFADMSVEDYRRQMELNGTTVFLGIKHAIRAMRPGGASGRGGSIINLSSAAGLKGVMGLGAYCASKGAVRLMTKAAAVECGRLNYGIRVNSIHPGLIKTEMGTKTLHDFVALGIVPDEATAEAAFNAAHLLGLGRTTDIAMAIRYLASDAARWITGTELVVDGGYSAA